MKIWKLRQVWIPPVLGVLLLTVPLVFGAATMATHSWNAWVLGIVVSVVAVAVSFLWFGYPGNKVTEEMTVLVGVMLFISPLILGAWLSAAAWVSCLTGAVFVVAAGGLLVENWSRQPSLPQQKSARAAETSHGYRRVSNPV